MKKERNLGIDLLKLVLALMIVVNHSIGHGLEQYDAALYENSKIALGFLWGVCNPAVNVFFIISGYFLIKRSVNKFIVLLEPQLDFGNYIFISFWIYDKESYFKYIISLGKLVVYYNIFNLICFESLYK